MISADLDEMRVRVALDRAVQRSITRYFNLTEEARESFRLADERIWAAHVPWIQSAREMHRREAQIAAYRRELQPWGDRLARTLYIAECARTGDKAKIESALNAPSVEDKIRLLSQV